MSTTSRRDRQLREIAALAAAGHLERAAGLALEHTAEFPDDLDLLPHLVGAADRPHGPLAQSPP